MDLCHQPNEILDTIIMYLPYESLVNIIRCSANNRRLSAYINNMRFRDILARRKREGDLLEHLLRLAHDPNFYMIAWDNTYSMTITPELVSMLINKRDSNVTIIWEEIPIDRDFWESVNDFDVTQHFDEESGQYFRVKIHLDIYDYINQVS